MLDAPVVNWWDNGLNQIAFGRQGKGFVIINNDDFPVIVTLNVCMRTLCILPHKRWLKNL